MKHVPFNLYTVVILLVMCKEITGLKCYQCSSLFNRGCLYDVKSAYLKECQNKTAGTPVCRLLTQLQYFTPSQEVVVVRECAYTYMKPLECVQSKFGNIHYSLSCECESDGCNKTVCLQQSWALLIVLTLYVMVIK